MHRKGIEVKDGRVSFVVLSNASSFVIRRQGRAGQCEWLHNSGWAIGVSSVMRTTRMTRDWRVRRRGSTAFLRDGVPKIRSRGSVIGFPVLNRSLSRRRSPRHRRFRWSPLSGLHLLQRVTPWSDYYCFVRKHGCETGLCERLHCRSES